MLPAPSPADLAQFPAPPAPPTPPVPPVPPLPAMPPADAQAAAAAPEPYYVGVPRTRDEVAALRARRTELSNQLESAASRRASLAARLRDENVMGADRMGLEQRLRVLDDRIVQIETDIATTGRQLTAADPALLTTQSVQNRFFDRGGRGIVQMMSITTVFLLVALVFSTARGVWRRAGRVRTPAPADPQRDERLARLETAVDAIAIEVERIAEGQRFVTRLLAESRQPAPVRVEAPAELVRTPAS